MNYIFKLYHTLKHLKLIQITNRFSRRYKRIKFIDVDFEVNKQLEPWTPFAISDSSYHGNESFKFLNVIDTVSDWNDKSKEKLWLYNLHYFDDLNQRDWQSRTSIHNNLIDTWIQQNPKMVGNGWEPYTISLRTVNWIKWFLSGNEPNAEWLSSLTFQVQALEQQLEYHLLGNHLFANAKGLIFAGCYFEGKTADAWLQRGLAILNKELPEQVLADGGNFELTPMYHNTVLADMLDLYQLSLVYPHKIPKNASRYWCELIGKMLLWAEHMQHPDGDVSFFNDSAMGIAPKLADLQRYAKLLNVPVPAANKAQVTALKESGYVVVNDKLNKLIIDTAKVGPDYIPGHAHADTLSFELSIDGHRIFVNSGTSVYGLGEERIRQRKTGAHNTVVVDGMDSSEVWSGFRVARRAYPSKATITESDGDVSVECSHDGYMRLPGKVVHTRKWTLAKNYLLIRDKLTGKYNHAEAHYHLHPDVRGEGPNDSGQIILHLPNDTQYTVSAEGADINLHDTTWHPEFGLSVKNKKLVFNFKQNEVNFVLTRA
ncbi:heparinase II/III family protein [Vibrio cyclitrophicus]|uniref:heparinase II/III family protein n=1 Tax=Vibrio cyclitrophicus TaxID=47951 RepID=UPI000C85FA31|nr:heparinase II/III family protein [Vibrio cyclitrophicus]PMJ47170.1 heparinase [Vibrio cyclitrophicus]